MKNEILERLKKEVEQFPPSPGVYLMKNEKDDVLYVGKAINLKVRVRSYLAGRDGRYQVQFLMRNVTNFEVIVTDTEKEALIVEDVLIKKHRPRYNINLKDDKTYLSLKIDMTHPFPRVEVVRKREKDKAIYFGPYSSAQALRETLRLLQRIFLLRNCTESYYSNRSRPCLSYQIKKCLGPCCGYIDEKEYKETISEVILFLEGKRKDLATKLKKRMKVASDVMNFEEAARLRDCIASIEKTLEKQGVFASHVIDQDVVGLYFQEDKVSIYILFVRSGKVAGGKSFIFDDREMPHSELMSSFLRRYYSDGRYVPKELILSLEIDDCAVMEEWLSELRGKNVYIKHPKRGDKLRLSDLAVKNAKNSFLSQLKKEKSHEELLKKIQTDFSLKYFPEKIECYDMSNFQGDQAVGSMVVFVGGEADNSLYRRFKIKTVVGANDFSMMHEVIGRRLKRGIEEGDLPNLILVDGGKGQLSMAIRALEENGLTEDIDLLALAKEKVFKSKGTEEKKEERIYMPGRKNPVKLKDKGNVLFLFQRIRDEAHRFAITYHRKLRSKKMFLSPLDAIEGIGPSKKKALLTHFGSLKKLKEASVEELEAISGISKKIAENIYGEFN